MHNGNSCWINDNYNWPYTSAMVNDEDEEKFKYAKDPAPTNVHYEVKGVMCIFLFFSRSRRYAKKLSPARLAPEKKGLYLVY